MYDKLNEKRDDQELDTTIDDSKPDPPKSISEADSSKTKKPDLETKGWTENIQETIKESRPVKIVSSPGITRGIATTTTIISGLTTAGVGTVIGLVSISVGAAMDTAQTRNMRQLRKENKLLIKYQNAIEGQEQMLKDNRKLAIVLEPELSAPKAKIVKIPLKDGPSQKQASGMSLYGFGKALLTKSIGIASQTFNTIASPTVTNIGKLANGVRGLYGDSKKQSIRDNVMENIKGNISKTRAELGNPELGDIDELAAEVRKQRIQTLAIKKVILKHPNLNDMPAKSIIKRFNRAKTEIEKTEKVMRSEYGTASIARDFVKAHTPMGKYTQMDKIKPRSRADIANDTKAPEPKSLNKKTAQELKQDVKKVASNINKNNMRNRKTQRRTGPKRRKTSRTR